MAKRAYVLYPKAAPDPNATSVSILGERCKRLLKPLTKNFWLITMITIVKSIWISPIATWLSFKNPGNGQPHIICPIDRYINKSKKTTDEHRRFLNVLISLSSISDISSSWDLLCFPAALSFCVAPYPASFTAWMIVSGAAVPSTVIELVKRLTVHSVTPSTFETAFSTRELQAAQLIPVTL